MGKNVEPIRLQVPVRADVAKAIERLASDLDRPSSWLAVELIKASLEDHETFCSWISLSFVGKAYDVVKGLLGRKAKEFAELPDVRLQLMMPADVANNIASLAKQWNESSVSTAGKLLASGVHNHEVFLEAIALGKRWRRKRSGGSGDTGSTVRHSEVA